jgi:hypothetical protein
MDEQVLSLSAHRTQQLAGLIDKSHASHMELETVVDWAQGCNRAIRPKRVDHSGIYGTPHWDALSEEQRVELLWLENADLTSGFIWLEEGLPLIFIKLLHEHQGRLPQPIYDYMMVFCKEEIVHTQMFRRYLKTAGLPVLPTPIDVITDTLVKMHPVAGVLTTYLTELAAENIAMCQDDPGADPLSRRIFQEHHREEVRHLAFGRWICEASLETFTPEGKKNLGSMIRAFMSTLIPRLTVNGEIGQYLSFDLDICDTEELARVQRSPNNRRLSQQRHGAMLDWVKRLGLAPADYDWFDPIVPPLPNAFERYA